jgi:hypothetical protein
MQTISSGDTEVELEVLWVEVEGLLSVSAHILSWLWGWKSGAVRQTHKEKVDLFALLRGMLTSHSARNTTAW